jgi:hypothetical protein
VKAGHCLIPRCYAWKRFDDETIGQARGGECDLGHIEQWGVDWPNEKAAAAAAFIIIAAVADSADCSAA